jgi:two-component system sensor histidine kinase YesM
MRRDRTSLTLRTSFRSLRRRLRDLSLNLKIIIYSLPLLMISVVLSALLYRQALSGLLLDRMSGISIQMLYSISANIRTMIETANEYSKIIAANSDVQNTLRRAVERYDGQYEPKVNTALAHLIGGSSLIESADVFDYLGNRYNAYKEPVKMLSRRSVREAEWYREVRERRGGLVIRLNGGGLFQPPRIPRNYVSVIREINSLHTQESIGIIIVNFPAETLERMYSGIRSEYRTEIAILDANDIFVDGTAEELGFDVPAFLAEARGRDSYQNLRTSGRTEYLVSYLRLPDIEWKILSVTPVREMTKEARTFSVIAFAVIAANSLLLFAGSVLISRSITVPIGKLIQSMKAVETGRFTRVDIRAGDNEIGQLRDGYNAMIVRIQALFSKIVEEQRLKRKIELDVLQAQIKPHFLYNTFDAISSLALSGKNRDVYAIMKALGTYYRTSLGRGREVITIGEELDVVVNYLKIQQYRYESMFRAEYEIDEAAKRYRILKLVLQPFVENALYHGIRPTGRSGTIRVRAKESSGSVQLEVEDDGAGMTEEQVERLMSGKELGREPGFGVWGTIERLKLFYGVENIVRIESGEGRGTKISIRVPAREEDSDE